MRLILESYQEDNEHWINVETGSFYIIDKNSIGKWVIVVDDIEIGKWYWDEDISLPHITNDYYL